MAYIVTLKISAPLGDYADIDAFDTAVRATIDEDVSNAIATALSSGDLLTYDKVLDEDATHYSYTFTYDWLDEAAYLAAVANPSVADDRNALNLNFIFEKTLP